MEPGNLTDEALGRVAALPVEDDTSDMRGRGPVSTTSGSIDGSGSVDSRCARGIGRESTI